MEDGFLKSTQNRCNLMENKDQDKDEEYSQSLAHNITKNQFLNAVKLLVDKPHVVNKKICGAQLKWFGVCHHYNPAFLLPLLSSKIHSSDLPNLNSSKVDVIATLLIKNGFERMNEDYGRASSTISWDKINCSALLSSTWAIIRNIIPKSVENGIEQILELVIIDGAECCVHYLSESMNAVPKVLPELSYTFKLVKMSVELHIWKDLPSNDLCSKWLQTKLLPCFIKWALQMDNEENFSLTSSLQLVDIHKYNTTYQELKQKYGPHLLENWNETTDPLKYIYEDIAISAYLLVMWAKERKDKNLTSKQSFLDLGCGNGLLVYLLTSEGHPGLGIDIKRRKIWDSYPSNITLKEEVIEPSDNHLYPEYDWLIGNHSDELTPWLPVIAAKSGLTNRFFVIPCCAFDFHCKFQRKNGKLSQYAEYLDYVENVGSKCGFNVKRDKLRIPSTKRVCFVGQERTYENKDWNKTLLEIDKFINSKCRTPAVNTIVLENHQSDCGKKMGLWCSDFQAREAVQKVRNCTQIGDEIRDKIINNIASLLLKEDNYLKVKKNDENVQWNKGGRISMRELVSVIQPQLKDLKKECGGLQTLLRNHRFIFELENDKIGLRVPEPISKRNISSERLRSKFCWFYQNHPQGCALTSENCTYMHEPPGKLS